MPDVKTVRLTEPNEILERDPIGLDIRTHAHEYRKGKLSNELIRDALAARGPDLLEEIF